MNDFRENYFIARDIVAKELIEKYNLVESYKDNERLTLDSNAYSIHFIFYIPDPPEIFISKKGKLPLTKDGYFGHITNAKKTMNEIDKALKSNALKLEPLPKEIDEYHSQSILRKFQICMLYFETEYPEYFFNIL